MSEKIFKTRNWMSILYPESSVDNWLSILEETCIPTFISPLHNMDIHSDGTPKKEHYHIIIMFDGPKTEKNAQDIFDLIGAIKCQPIHSLKGQVSYLTHLNSPDKFQYNSSDVISLNGANYNEILDSVTNYRGILKEILVSIDGINCNSLYDLTQYAMETGNEDWFIVCTEKYSYFLDKYLKSRHWAINN